MWLCLAHEPPLKISPRQAGPWEEEEGGVVSLGYTAARKPFVSDVVGLQERDAVGLQLASISSRAAISWRNTARN